MTTITHFTFTPKGPFDLSNQTQYFGEWISPGNDPEAIAMTFPVEGWKGSATVVLKQTADGKLHGQKGNFVGDIDYGTCHHDPHRL